MTSLTHLFVAVLAVPFALFSSPASSERESPDVHLLHNEGSWTLYYSGAYGGFSASCMIITSNADDETLLVDITNESFDISMLDFPAPP